MVKCQLRQNSTTKRNVESDSLKGHMGRGTPKVGYTIQKPRLKIVTKSQRNSITKEIFEEL